MSPALHPCIQRETIASMRRDLDALESTLPNFDALLPELGKIHQKQGEILERLTGVETILEATAAVTRNLSDELARLTPLVADLALWRGEGQTREIEALRATVLEQARAEAQREAEDRKDERTRTALRYRLAQAVILAVISAASLLVGRSCGIHESKGAAPAAAHSSH
jgi:hypothetical protein